MNLAQGNKESLEDLLTKFNNVALNIKDLQNKVASHTIVMRLRHLTFHNHLWGILQQQWQNYYKDWKSL